MIPRAFNPILQNSKKDFLNVLKVDLHKKIKANVANAANAVVVANAVVAKNKYGIIMI